MNEVALFLAFTLRNPAAGVAMAQVALGHNPACAPELWNTLGDCYYEAGDLQEARSAYQRALEVNGGDVQARYNLAWVEARERRYAAALEHLAAALAHDATCAWYDRLVKKQAEVLQLLAQ
jgi:tetratricopeptide (TPR) repeat protein